MICPICGAQNKDSSVFCLNCGYQISSSSTDNATEKEAYTDTRPEKGSRYAVMSPISYILFTLLYCLPIVGWFFLIVWAFGGCENKNRQNHALSILIPSLIVIVAFILMSIFGVINYNIILSIFGM